ncbi:hypothetical protein P12x_001736 [Tundrisphaera lichenicola]|uniref:hypothetical protein n=1 Tax=Tundrisphaera lichenicola TaxID=2029860 RepID=UPI003EBBEF80
MHKEPTPSNCPVCGGSQVAAILYGLVDLGEPVSHDLDAGRVVLGGCSTFEESPEWHCLDCEHEWGLIDCPESQWVDY